MNDIEKKIDRLVTLLNLARTEGDGVPEFRPWDIRLARTQVGDKPPRWQCDLIDTMAVGTSDDRCGGTGWTPEEAIDDCIRQTAGAFARFINKMRLNQASLERALRFEEETRP